MRKNFFKHFTLLLALVAGVFFASAQTEETGTFRVSPNRQPDTMAGGDQFPKDALWFNTDFPLSMQVFRNKGLLVVVWHPWAIDAVSYVQRFQEITARNPQIQVVSIWPVKKEQNFSRGQLLDFIQLFGINHPVGVVSDVSTFPSLNSTALPQSMLYRMSSTPEVSGYGPAGLEQVLARLEEWTSDSKILSSMYPWLVRGEADALRYANPVVELPTRLSVGSGGDIMVSEPAQHRVVIVTGDGQGKTVFGNRQAGYSDGMGYTSKLSNPSGTAYNSYTNEYYIADPGNHRVRVADPQGYLMYTLIGNGRYSRGVIDSLKGVLISVGLPVDVEVIGRKVYVLSAGSNQLFECESALGNGRAIADFPLDRMIGGTRVIVSNLAAGAKGLYTVMSDGSLWFSQIKDSGGKRQWSTSEIYSPEGNKPMLTAVCEFKGKVYVVMAGKHQVGLFEKGQIKVISGSGDRGWKDGAGNQALFSSPTDIVAYNGRLLVADMGNHVLRLINPKNGKSQTIGFQPVDALLDLTEPLAAGDPHYTDSLLVAPGVNRIRVVLNIEGWKLLPSGRNEVTADVTGGIGLDSEELSGPEFSCSFYPDANDGYVQFELTLTLHSVDNPELIIQKKALYSFEVRIRDDAPANHERVFRPRLLPE